LFYALNNPLSFIDPTGWYPAPNPEGSSHGEKEHKPPPFFSPTGNYVGRNPFPSRGAYPGFEHYYTWVEGTEGSGWVHNSNFENYSGEDAEIYYASITGNVDYLYENISVISDQVDSEGSRRVVYDNGLVVTRNIGTGQVIVEFGVNIYGDQIQLGQCGPQSCMDCHGIGGLYYDQLAPYRRDFNLAVSTAVLSGLGQIPALGYSASSLTYGQRLFISSRFGITSTRFGNSVAYAQGSWNVPGSFFKLGWSTTGKFGGGYAFRLGVGSAGNTARYHLYLPKTFVPNSFANPSIMLKRALFIP
jgi:hypothetical protein